MFFLTKKIDIVCSHHHGNEQKKHWHTLSIIFSLRSQTLSANSRICDIESAIGTVRSLLEGKCLNEVMEVLPTLENIAYTLCHMVSGCYKVQVFDNINEQATFLKNEEKG